MAFRLPIQYFVDANSSAGYVDLFGQSFGGLANVQELSDFPEETAGELLTRAAQEAEARGLRVEWIHNCLTDRHMGLIVPQLSAGVINRQTWRPGALSALAAQEDESLLAARTALQAAWDSFGQARVVHDEWERYYIETMDFAAADRLAEETCESLIGGKRSLTGKGACVERFFGAATVSGSVDHIRSITQELERRYFLKGRPGTGKSTFLKRIAAAAQENGFDVEFYRCSLDPNSCDMVLIRELGFCVFDSTAPHEYFPERPGDEEIDLYRAAVREGTDERYAAELADVESRYRACVRQASASLAEAWRMVEAFQRNRLPSFSAEQLASQRETLLAALFRD